MLLGYFGEPLEQDCGNCDICLDPPECYDATLDAQKALSCVYRVGQRFGMGHVVDVLRGAHTTRIRQLGHDRLSTYGIGSRLSADAWLGLLRQLIHLGYLEQDIARYSVLRLTPKAGPLLRGEKSLTLARPRTRVLAPNRMDAAADEESTGSKCKRKREHPAPTSKTVAVPAPEEALFQTLRELRRRIATEQRVPAYVVFSDATLRAMAAVRPLTEDDMLSISGVGAYKLAKYGREFLAVIKENPGTEASVQT